MDVVVVFGDEDVRLNGSSRRSEGRLSRFGLGLRSAADGRFDRVHHSCREHPRAAWIDVAAGVYVDRLGNFRERLGQVDEGYAGLAQLGAAFRNEGIGVGVVSFAPTRFVGGCQFLGGERFRAGDVLAWLQEVDVVGAGGRGQVRHHEGASEPHLHGEFAHRVFVLAFAAFVPGPARAVGFHVVLLHLHHQLLVQS